jgi:IclR family KDG regulon transcriptional repressor
VTPAPRNHATLSSVGNAARLLKEFRRTDGDLGVTELSRRLGIGKSTAHRLASTLAEEGLLERDPDTGTYRLGLIIFELGAAVASHRDLHTASLPALEKLRNLTGETVQIAVLDGREVVYVERRDSQHSVRLFTKVGHRNFAHCTSNGKVLLAWQSDDQLAELLTGWRLPRRTPYTITEHSALRTELRKVRRQGFAENINESELGTASVAAPIRNSMGEVVASISVAGPVQRLDGDSLQRFARPVVESGVAISRRLGFRDPNARIKEG